MAMLWWGLEQKGDAVRIKDTWIPALNIFVGDDLCDPRVTKYNVYFNVMFEDGDFWIVTVEFWENDLIRVHKCLGFNEHGSKHVLVRDYRTWNEFLAAYKEKIKPYGHSIHIEREGHIKTIYLDPNNREPPRGGFSLLAEKPHFITGERDLNVEKYYLAKERRKNLDAKR